ncbi:MAG: RNA polymerase sigma factor region1.1 domain-containing protein, partial [Candidatus Cloacimonadota bacterium]|nr:RNA polymerase sigma factor region1.1 domain-containing protein [Candidatus Cloacimonadota bacterium]
MLSYNECIKKLIELGKKNNHLLTFKQINDVLPNNPIFLDRIDDIITELTESGIDLIDETQKRVTKKRVSVKKKSPKKFKNRRYYDDP